MRLEDQDALDVYNFLKYKDDKAASIIQTQWDVKAASFLVIHTNDAIKLEYATISPFHLIPLHHVPSQCVQITLRIILLQAKHAQSLYKWSKY